MSNIQWEKISMGIISEAGVAKSLAMEGIFAAKKENFELANEKIKESNIRIDKASQLHLEIIQAEAKGEQLEFKVIFMHAEDQLLSTQTIILMATEIIELHKKINSSK